MSGIGNGLGSLSDEEFEEYCNNDHPDYKLEAILEGDYGLKNDRTNRNSKV